MRSKIQPGERVHVVHETGIHERGTVVGASVEPITKVRSLTILFDGDTYFTVPEFRANRLTALERVHEWGAKHLQQQPNVHRARVVDTGGGVLAVAVDTTDNEHYIVSFSRYATGAPLGEAWSADSDPNDDDEWTDAATAVEAFRAERRRHFHVCTGQSCCGIVHDTGWMSAN